MSRMKPRIRIRIRISIRIRIFVSKAKRQIDIKIKATRLIWPGGMSGAPESAAAIAPASAGAGVPTGVAKSFLHR